MCNNWTMPPFPCRGIVPLTRGSVQQVDIPRPSGQGIVQLCTPTVSLATLSRGRGRRAGPGAGHQRARAAQPGQLHDRVAGLPDDGVGGDEEGPVDADGGGAGIHQRDGRLRGRPADGAAQPGADRRRLLRAVARPPAAPVGPPRGHGPRLRVRGVDGRVGPRLRGRLGRGVGADHPVGGAGPQPGLHRRRHVHPRAGDGQERGAPRPADPVPGDGGGGALQPGGRHPGQGPGRRVPAHRATRARHRPGRLRRCAGAGRGPAARSRRRPGAGSWPVRPPAPRRSRRRPRRARGTPTGRFAAADPRARRR